MPPGIVGEVHAVHFSADKVYAGGAFNDAGGLNVTNVAYFDPNTERWHTMGTGLADTVRDLTVDTQGRLYAASGNGLYRWDGSTWQNLTRVSGPIHALFSGDGRIYLGGEFASDAAGTQTLNSIAIYENQTLQDMDEGFLDGAEFPGIVYDITMDGDGRLLVGGRFRQSGGTTLWHLAQWEDETWQPLRNSGVFGGDEEVRALAIRPHSEFQNQQVIFVGGEFTGVGPENQPIGANNIAIYENGSWSNLNGGLDSTVYSLHQAPSGFNGVFAGGKFIFTDTGTRMNRIAKWDGTSGWITLMSGMPGDPADFDYVVRSMDVEGGSNLYAGGEFREAGDKHVNNIGQWQLGFINDWEALGNGINRDGEVHALATTTGDIYAGGNIISAGGVQINGLARWDGSEWHDVGDGVFGVVHTLSLKGDSLYVGGEFPTAGGGPGFGSGVPASNIALWDGSGWQGLGSGTDGPVYATEVLSSGDLYVGGDFSSPYSNVATWSGGSWLEMNGGTNGPVHALEYTGFTLVDFDDFVPEFSPTFAVGGTFDQAGSQQVNNLASWNTDGWGSYGNGVKLSGGSATVYSLEETGTGNLYVGGNFSQVEQQNGNNISASYLARFTWNTGWEQVSGAPDGVVRTLKMNGCNLYAGGEFNKVANHFVHGIARFDGEWNMLGDGMYSAGAPGSGSTVRSITLQNTSVFAGGNFAATGRSPSSNFAKWDNGVGKLPTSRSLTLTSPSANDSLEYGELARIQWQFNNVDSIRVEYSTDNRQTWHTLDSSMVPDNRQFDWRVPDSTTNHAYIRITETAYPCHMVESGPFTIEGTASGNIYHLARTHQGGVDLYYPSVDGWSWENDEGVQWPDSVHSRSEYDYDDCSEYPVAFRSLVNKPDSTFPSFPAVEHALGHAVTIPNAVYSCNPPNFRYNRGPNAKGTLFWQKAATDFMGVCAGFANTSLIQFEYPGRMNPYSSTFNRTYNVPNVDSVFTNVDVNTGSGPQIRDLINLMWTRQFNKSTLLAALQRSQRSNSQLINQLQHIFTSPQGSRQLRALSIWDLGISLQSLNNLDQQVRQMRGYAHVVTPYRLERDENNSNLWRLYIYDNNDAGNDSLFIRVNTNTGYWEYPQDSVNSSHQGTALFLMDPVTEYLRDDPPAIFREETGTNPRTASAGGSSSPEIAQDEYLRILHSRDNEILMRGPDRQAMGIKEGVTINERRGEVLPIQPLAGGREEPLGFMVPRESYEMQMTQLSENVELGVFGENVAYSYSRNDGKQFQTDNISYSEEGLGIGNPDEGTKQVRLISAYESSEFDQNHADWLVSTSDIRMTGRDSIFQSIEEQSAVRFENHGSDYAYTLKISAHPVDADTGNFFLARNVPMPVGNVHHIHWDFQAEPAVRVYVNEDTDSAYEDTLFLDNEFPRSQDAEGQTVAEYMRKTFLFQDDLAFDWPSTDNLIYNVPEATSEPDSASPYHPISPYQSPTTAYGQITDSLTFEDPERPLELGEESLRFFSNADIESTEAVKMSLEDVPDPLSEFIQTRDISYRQIAHLDGENPTYLVMQEHEGLAFPGLVYTNDMLYADPEEENSTDPGLVWFVETAVPTLSALSPEELFNMTMQFRSYRYTDGEWTVRTGDISQTFHGKLMGRGNMTAVTPGMRWQELSENYRLLFTELEIMAGDEETTISDSTVVSLQPHEERYYLAGLYDIGHRNDIPWITGGELFNARHIPTSRDADQRLPDEYALHANFPNPFNPVTTIRYDLPEASGVSLTVFNSLGQKVATLVRKQQEAGVHKVTWDGSDARGQQLSSGMYFYRLKAGDFQETRKMILVK